ncbi:hypothetical protein [Plesiomonas shigelloides]|uniref:Uncharacterized protein n=2 Tax=Plesiomonas shigelloides TaxID=703 RepID=R8AQ73_PLESH|nr:hypothetical protein [Plesiomonas shigelloides]EON88475.1 hypothetical protein PLESHI_10039 [Plesiomonas shigelloides 302-73]MBO1107724.1 hypothetical protein [Plesiomonas shigelloides]
MQEEHQAWNAGACQLTTYDICIAMTLACLKGDRINHDNLEKACLHADNAIRKMVLITKLKTPQEQD